MKHAHLSLGFFALLAACQHPLMTTDTAGTDASDTVSIDDVPPTDGSDPHAQLSYMPMGCSYTVHTTPGSLYNAMGDANTFGAMPDPQHVHVTWASDPSTTAAILWATDADTHATVVQYGTDMASLTQSATGHISSGGSGAAAVHMHETHLCGLTPNTTYYYKVGGEGHWSAVQQFKTAPASGGTGYDVNFAVAGDSRDSFSIWQMVQSQVLSVAGAHQPDFFLFSGDAVALGTDQGAWNQWMDAASGTMRLMPYVMAHGNHDALAINYLVQFAQPQPGSMEQDELYFSYDYGPVHIVVLNDTPYMGDIGGVVAGTEKTWLMANLAAVDRVRTPWVVVMHHKPAFSSSTHANDSDTLQIRANWPPVYDANHVDVVFNGHDHDFEVTQPLRGDGTIASGAQGTVYYTAAGAGAQLYPSGTSPFTRYSESVVNFLLVHATEHALNVTPYRLDGTVISAGTVMLTR